MTTQHSARLRKAVAAYYLAETRAEIAKVEPSRQRAEYYAEAAQEAADAATEAADEAADDPRARDYANQARNIAYQAMTEYRDHYALGDLYPAPVYDTHSDADPGL